MHYYHPKDAAAKARCQKVVDDYLAFQATQKAKTVKRNRTQDESDKTAKKQKVLQNPNQPNAHLTKWNGIIMARVSANRCWQDPE